MRNIIQNPVAKIIKIQVFLIILGLIINSYAQDAVVIDLDSTHQIIRGFGAANILQWRPDMTDSEIETAFGTGDGQLGFTILRLRIQPQSSLWSTNVATAKKAYEMGAIIIAAPWNPPDELLDPESDQRRVNPDMYTEYAYHLDDFNYFMELNGVPIYAISVQNEPDYGDWTRWTSAEMLTFMRDYAHFIQTRVMAPESFQFRHPFSDPILNDSTACENLAILAGHIYGGGAVAYPLAESKGKELWMTEHYTDSQNSANLWPMALDVGTDIHRVMNAGMSAYVWWYIVRYYGPISDGTMNSGEKGDVTKRGYIMSQYARFIRPGYYRVECDDYPQTNVFVTAYKDAVSAKAVIVAVNTSTEPKEQTFTFQNGGFETVAPYVTSETKNCLQENDIAVSDGSFSTTLDGQSVTTFVAGSNANTVENSLGIPKSYKLFQNYPNPFNPVTQINFTIPEKSFISLKVYNLLGNEVDELAGKEYSPGVYSVMFNASQIATGIYFYTLRANNHFVQTKKMFVIQ